MVVFDEHFITSDDFEEEAFRENTNLQEFTQFFISFPLPGILIQLFRVYVKKILSAQ